jgi:hypothetical protein|tara:strand:- start:23 stop:229 length:207 start_codon:yes stop_codon:yes gene_type:complete
MISVKKILGILVVGLGLVLFSENVYAENTCICLGECFCHGYSGKGGPCYNGIGGTGEFCPEICNCNLL